LENSKSEANPNLNLIPEAVKLQGLKLGSGGEDFTPMADDRSLSRAAGGYEPVQPPKHQKTPDF